MADPKRIIKLIEWELDNNCDERVYPQVCTQRTNPRQREMIIRSAVNMIAKEGFSVSAAIAQIESELQGARG